MPYCSRYPLVRVPRASGFTLVELVAVLVILGVLAAVGGRAMADLRAEARAAAVQRVAAQVKDAAERVHMKFVLAGGDPKVARWMTVEGCATYFYYGYPQYHAIACFVNVQGLDQNWGPMYGDVAGWRFYPTSEWRDGYVGQSRCHADYVHATASSPAYVVVDVSDCRQNNVW